MVRGIVEICELGVGIIEGRVIFFFRRLCDTYWVSGLLGASPTGNERTPLRSEFVYSIDRGVPDGV